MMPAVRFSLAGLALCVAAGCTTIEDVIPQDGPLMSDIYAEHEGQVAGGAPPSPTVAFQAARADLAMRPAYGGEALPVGFTRTALNETRALFPKLPNPELVMFVYPHVSPRDNAPVPGYTTVFPLYDRAEYALPGEVAQAPAMAGFVVTPSPPSGSLIAPPPRTLLEATTPQVIAPAPSSSPSGTIAASVPAAPPAPAQTGLARVVLR